MKKKTPKNMIRGKIIIETEVERKMKLSGWGQEWGRDIFFSTLTLYSINTQFDASTTDSF